MIKALQDQTFEQFTSAGEEQDLIDFQKSLHEEGYYGFYRLIKGFELKLKSFADEEAEPVKQLIAKAKAYFPRPIEFSLSFQFIWRELEEIRAYKADILERIPQEDRSGEWQIIMDNPHTNQEVVCYPALTFAEAACLFGYSPPQLEKNRVYPHPENPHGRPGIRERSIGTGYAIRHVSSAPW